MDMQDQPKYKTYRAGDRKYGVNGASARPLVEGTVPRRGSGAEYRDIDDYFYTGKTAGASAGGMRPPSGGDHSPIGLGMGAYSPGGMQTGEASGASELVRGSAAGGADPR